MVMVLPSGERAWQQGSLLTTSPKSGTPAMGAVGFLQSAIIVGGFQDQVAFHLELERLLEKRGYANGLTQPFSPTQGPPVQGHGPSGYRARRQGKPRVHARAGWKSLP